MARMFEFAENTAAHVTLLVRSKLSFLAAACVMHVW